MNGMAFNSTQHDTNQPSLLDPSDSAVLTNFFDNTDISSKASQYFNPGFPFGMDSKVDTSSMANGMGLGAHGGTVDPTSTLAGAQGASYQTHSGNSHMLQGPMASFPGYSYASNENDAAEAGAGALMNMSSQGHMHGAGANPLNAVSWGSMGMAGIQQPESPVSPMTSSRQSISSVPGSSDQTHMNIIQAIHQSGYYPQGAPLDRRQHMNPNFHATHQQYWQGGHGLLSASNYNRFADTPANMSYGSDPNFMANRYRALNGTAHEQGSKGNLMGVPLADKAADGQLQSKRVRQMSQPGHISHQQSTSHNSSSTSSPGAQLGGLPIRNTTSMTTGNQHRAQQQCTSSARAAHHDDDDDDLQQSHPRKRRKSQMQRNDDAEYMPERAPQGSVPKRGPKVPKAAEVAISEEYEPYTPSTKRQKSTVMDVAQYSRSSDSPTDTRSPDSGGEASASKRRSRDSKSRANLSEDQKRQNHILSEQKRRNVIKQGFTDLNRLVPGLNGGKSGLSRADVIQEVVSYLENVLTGNEFLMERLGIDSDELGVTSFDGIEAY